MALLTFECSCVTLAMKYAQKEGALVSVRNDSNPRDTLITARVYGIDKDSAMNRALENGDSLAYLVACFVAGYGAGYALPDWFDKIDLKADPMTRVQLSLDLPETDG